MKTVELTVTRIGNSRGVRLPAATLRRYRIEETVVMEERDGEIVLRPKKAKKLSWDETFREMAAAKEDWSDCEAVAGDGLDEN